MRPAVKSKNSPSPSTVSPSSSDRTRPSATSVRRPRVRGSTPQTSISCRSSPPTPTPTVSRPGAAWASDAIWRAATIGCRKREEVHAEVQVESTLQAAQCGEVDQAVEAAAVEEADVVGGEQVVDAGIGDPRERRRAGRSCGSCHRSHGTEIPTHTLHPTSLRTAADATTAVRWWSGRPAHRGDAGSSRTTPIARRERR